MHDRGVHLMPLSTIDLHLSLAIQQSMSTVLLIIIIFLLSLPINTCNARYLKGDSEVSNTLFDHLNKGFGKMNVNETSVPMNNPAQSSSRGELATVDETEAGTNVGKPKGLKKPREDVDQEKREGSSSGTETMKPSSRAGLAQITQYEVRLEKRVRSLLGYESNEEHIEYSNEKETISADRLVAMDYPRAQRGPSVHNR